MAMECVETTSVTETWHIDAWKSIGGTYQSCVIMANFSSNSVLFDTIYFFIKRSSFEIMDTESVKPPSSGAGSFLRRIG
jgi:hypothetical protein